MLALFYLSSPPVTPVCTAHVKAVAKIAVVAGPGDSWSASDITQGTRQRGQHVAALNSGWMPSGQELCSGQLLQYKPADISEKCRGSKASNTSIISEHARDWKLETAASCPITAKSIADLTTDTRFYRASHEEQGARTAFFLAWHPHEQTMS